MPTYTPNLSLAKPANTEVVDIEVLNANWDTLDTRVNSLSHTDETKVTTETINNKSVTWFVRRYQDGRMEIESNPVTYSVPIRTAWDVSWYRSNMAMQWVFPYTFKSINLYECKAVETSELCAEVPVLNKSSEAWVSVLNMSGWKTYLFYIAPDPKTATIKIRCRVTGKWK